MKKWFFMIFVLCVFALCILYNDMIISFLVTNFGEVERKTTILQNNTYATQRNYKFVQLTESFKPSNKQDLINIYYTILNSGMDSFTFYCPNEYKDCINDVDYLSNNQILLSNINNFVPIYNSFQNIETEFNNLGKVTISIHHNYTKEEILALEEILTYIVQENIIETMKVEDKIKTIHDYIINTTKYDTDRSDNKGTTYHSDNAYGALVEHYAICGGYADSMKLFLDYFGIPNYKISSENHIWNLVYLDSEWRHLDLTWDDPVTSDGKDVLEYDYFLISTEELSNLKTDQHVFDKTIYLEAN